MANQLMRCQYCGLLQDEPDGVKVCAHCGGELAYEGKSLPSPDNSYIDAWLELDQVVTPVGKHCDRYLLCTIQTPKQLPQSQVAHTLAGRPPLNFCAVLDISGSMQGEKISQAKQSVRQAVRYLSAGDVFSLVTFSDDVRCILEQVKINQHVRQVVDHALDEITAGGMTALCGGLQMGIGKVTAMMQETNLLLLLSDGLANVGETDIEIIGQHANRARQQGITVSTLGIGADYSEAMMIEIANQGAGRFYHLQHAGQIPAYLIGELGETAALAASETTLVLSLPPNATLVPFSTAYQINQGDGKGSVSIGVIPIDTEIEIPLRLVLPPQAANTKQAIDGELCYRSPAGHHLVTRLNRVTLRFVSAETFNKRDGVVIPVAERVLSQMKSANVLNVSRAYAKSISDGEQQTNIDLAVLREYASKLGENRAEEEVYFLQNKLQSISASGIAAKMNVSEAYINQRRTKDFSKD